MPGSSTSFQLFEFILVFLCLGFWNKGVSMDCLVNYINYFTIAEFEHGKHVWLYAYSKKKKFVFFYLIN